MPRYQYPEYDEVREDYDGELGNLMGWDLHGHLPFEDVDLFLAVMDWDYGDTDPSGDFEVEHLWRCTVPAHDLEGNEIDDYWSYDYSTEESEGRIPVTRVWSSWITRYWCINHPMEPYNVGVPASSIVDGEAIVDAQLLAQEDLLEAHPVVSRLSNGPGYIHFCRDCYNDYDARLRAARAEALKQYEQGKSQP